jgi:hypothetical protein
MKPSLDEFIAALPECPDCGEKLHRFAYCPGRRQIRPEAMQHPTQTEEKEHTMSNAIVTKQGKPSASGEVVDTSAAKVVPPSSEVKTEAAAREVAEQNKATQAKINGLAKKMTGGAKPAAKGKGSTKAKAAAKPSPKKGVPLARITESWTGKGGKEVVVGSVVKAPGIASLTCVGRWTKRKGEQKIPFITGTTPDGTRKNVAAADCTVVKGPAAKK